MAASPSRRDAGGFAAAAASQRILGGLAGTETSPLLKDARLVAGPGTRPQAGRQAGRRQSSTDAGPTAWPSPGSGFGQRELPPSHGSPAPRRRRRRRRGASRARAKLLWLEAGAPRRRRRGGEGVRLGLRCFAPLPHPPPPAQESWLSGCQDPVRRGRGAGGGEKSSPRKRGWTFPAALPTPLWVLNEPFQQPGASRREEEDVQAGARRQHALPADSR